ncbi:MAG: helix-turn-helix transcriptional regulator [Pseudomonadota bacterium]
MAMEHSESATITESYQSPVNDSPALSTILKLAEQLEPEQLDGLVAQLGKLRLRRHSAVTPDETQQLTEREKEVLVLVASGYNRKEIGRALRISACTAAKHISNIYRKLGVSTIAEATRMALVQNVSLVN